MTHKILSKSGVKFNPSEVLPKRSGVYKVLHETDEPELEAYAYYDATAKRWFIANWVGVLDEDSTEVQIQGAANLRSYIYSEYNYRWRAK